MTFSICNIDVTTAQEILWVLLNHGNIVTHDGELVDVPATSARGNLSVNDLPAEKQPPSSETTKETNKSSPLYALVIGIDNYQSSEVDNLYGACADADAISDYLIKKLNVPSSQITNLRNAQATRDNIISKICDLGEEDDHHVKHGDPILIFYAGHGASGPAPQEWGADSSKIQFIVPHDCRINVNGNKIPAIPDRTLGAFLRMLADTKGNNITVIFDCCYSSSATRQDKVMAILDPTRISRGFELRHDEVHVDLDRSIWKSAEQGRGTAIATGFANAGLNSHILLAACGADEKAQEQGGRGMFTCALLDVLNDVDASKLTYTDLMRRIGHLPGQNPQCEGVDPHRSLFNGLAPSYAQILYHVYREGEKYVLEAGEVHGITDGMEFAVVPSRDFDIKNIPMGTLRSELDLIQPFRSELRRLSDATFPFDIPAYSFALPTRAGESEALRLHVPVDLKLISVFQAITLQLTSRVPGQRTIVLVDKDKADLSVGIDANGKVEFNLCNSVTTGYGLTRLYYTLPPQVRYIQPVIPAAAHFFWHLRRQPKECVLHHKVDLSFHKLVETGKFDDTLKPIMQASKENLNVRGVVDIDADDETPYGMTIQNKSAEELYVSLFYFDCSKLSVSSYYTGRAATSAQVDAPLCPKGSFPIGYGASGSPPSKFRLAKNQTLDVGYIRLFISTCAVDISNIAQPSPFTSAGRGGHKKKVTLLPRPLWDVITVAVVQRQKGMIKAAEEQVKRAL